MEDPLQQERKESEYKDPNEEEGGIRRRLRDRDLLRKRKAEAEEKETNQEESPRKRRAGVSSGAKRRGRPRKAEPLQEISESAAAAAAAAGPAVVVVSEPAQIDPDQTFFTLSAVDAQPASVTAALLPAFESVQSSSLAPAPTPSASTNPTQAPPVPEPASTKAPDEGPITVQDQTPALAPDDPGLVQTPAPSAPPAADVAPPAAPNETKGEDREGQVTIEDLGPDVEEDLSQTKITDEDLNGTTTVDITGQSEVISAPSFSSLPSSQEYLPGNSL
uniref:Hemogen n=1 Tax=Tetraodon nigroviridis TaxID=99883 RepID=H3D0D9_TETNG